MLLRRHQLQKEITKKYYGVSFVHSHQGYFKKTISIEEEVKNNFINVLLANRGERLLRPDFGCDFRKLVFEQSGNDMDMLIETRIQEQADRWLPYVELKNVGITTTATSKLLEIKYSTPNIQELQIIGLEIKTI